MCYIRDNPVRNGRRHFFWPGFIFHDEVDRIQFSNDFARTECCWREREKIFLFFSQHVCNSVQIINAQIMKSLIENLKIKNLLAGYIESLMNDESSQVVDVK